MSFTFETERFPIRGEFRIARGSKTVADVLVATFDRDGIVGRGESVPYARYGETPEAIASQIASHRALLETLADRETLRENMPAGAVRNAIDLAMTEHSAKRRAIVSPRIEEVRSALTLSLAEPDAMARAAADIRGTLLKLKLAGDGRDGDRMRAVHEARPDAELWLDANEGLDVDRYRALVPLLEELPVVLLEQPFAAKDDAILAKLPRPVPICADESVHDRASLASLADRYDAINVKLDKTGGLTEARDLVRAAQALDLQIVIGCMVCTSLAIAPAFVLAASADFVDLDGALFLDADRAGGIALEDGMIRAPERALWMG